MKITLGDKLIAYLAMLSGLSISAVAIYYSVAGLMSIFAAAMIPIMIMGVVLEVGKLSATVWLKQNWNLAPRFLKIYLLVAIVILMLITSMGIFGYLSKAHLDQAVPTGDIADKVALIDERIKTQRDNIDAAKKAIQQMDNQVNERLSRSNDDRGAERAVQIRKQQAKERESLQRDIAKAQAEITKLNEERSPVAKELRKVEAEVGPIKYIAALIYGDNPDQNLLESAVRWVIIIIVLVFDPLAVILLLASQYSFMWFRKIEETNANETLKDEYDFSNGVRGPVIPPEEPVEQTPWPFPSHLPKIESPEVEVKDETIKDAVVEETVLKVENTVNVEQTAEPSKDEIIESEVSEIVDPQPEPEPTVDTVETDHGHYIGLDVDDESSQEQEEKIIDEAHAREKEAMKKWKAENPDSSLKQQRVLLERGVISELPWEKYIEDLSEEDEAAAEAAKWAQEQLDKKKDSKKKDNPMDGEIRQESNPENVGEVTYQQNAEQSSATIWQRIKDLKNDR